MAYFECQCPNCSLPTVFNDGRLQCYCINCGYLIRRENVSGTEPVVSGSPAESLEKPAEDSDGLVTVLISVSGKSQPFTFHIDDEEVLKTTGGSYRVRTTPGHHTLRIRQNLFSETRDIEVSEGTRVDVAVGMMGIRVNVH